MYYPVTYVARAQRLDPIKFVEFSKTHDSAFVEEGVLITCTMFVDALIKDFLADGNERIVPIPS